MRAAGVRAGAPSPWTHPFRGDKRRATRSKAHADLIWLDLESAIESVCLRANEQKRGHGGGRAAAAPAGGGGAHRRGTRPVLHLRPHFCDIVAAAALGRLQKELGSVQGQVRLVQAAPPRHWPRALQAATPGQGQTPQPIRPWWVHLPVVCHPLRELSRGLKFLALKRTGANVNYVLMLHFIIYVGATMVFLVVHSDAV